MSFFVLSLLINASNFIIELFEQAKDITLSFWQLSWRGWFDTLKSTFHSQMELDSFLSRELLREEFTLLALIYSSNHVFIHTLSL
jgi:hypothetical protein